jgi:hypothetical protein
MGCAASRTVSRRIGIVEKAIRVSRLIAGAVELINDQFAPAL